MRFCSPVLDRRHVEKVEDLEALAVLIDFRNARDVPGLTAIGIDKHDGPIGHLFRVLYGSHTRFTGSLDFAGLCDNVGEQHVSWFVVAERIETLSHRLVLPDNRPVHFSNSHRVRRDGR